MKLIIDIPEREYKVICENNYVAVCACPNLLSNAIKNGTPIPDNATNGYVIKAMFPKLEWTGACKDVDFYLLDSDTPYSAKLNTFRNWWNAPYQKGGK